MGNICSSCFPASQSVAVTSTPPHDPSNTVAAEALAPYSPNNPELTSNSPAHKPNDVKISTPPPHDGPPSSISSSSSLQQDNKLNGPRDKPIPPPPPTSNAPPQCQTAQEQKLVEDTELDVLISIIVNSLHKVKLTSLKKKRVEHIEIPLISHGAGKLGSTGVKDLQEIVEEGTSCAETLTKYLTKSGNGSKDITHAIIPILETIGSYHWVSATLFIVAKVLERLEAISENLHECLNLLEEMASLAFLLKQINDRQMSPQLMEQEIRNAVEMIFKGYLLCCFQMESSRIRSFFTTTYDKTQLDLLRRQIDSTHRKLSSHMSICIYDAITCINKPPPRPRSIIYPKHAIGIGNQVAEVIRMLDYQSNDNAVGVILHNFGGMGKTTLGDAVFSSLDIKDYKYSMVKLFETTNDTPNIIELQKRIISDLSGEDVPISYSQQGQQEIERILKDVNAFIYIDDVVKSRESNELKKLLPHDLSGAKKLRILITTRDNNVIRTSLHGCAQKVYTVKGLGEEHVSCILEKVCADKLLPSQKKDLIKACKGVPLLVDLVAAFIGSNENVKKAYEVVISHYENMQTPTGDDFLEVFAIDTLEEEVRESFLDICFYFAHNPWDEVENIFGLDVMNVLQSRALVTKKVCHSLDMDNGPLTCDSVIIHDVLLDIARKKAGHNRLVLSSYDEVLKLAKSLGKKDERMDRLCLKGLRFSAAKEDFVKKPPHEFEVKIVDALFGSIRILDICDPFILIPEGFKGMNKLIYLQMEPRKGFEGCLDFSRMPNLKVLHVNAYGHTCSPYLLSKMPESLQFLTISGAPFDEIRDEDFHRLKNLRSIEMELLDTVKKLPESMDQLKKLKYLRLDACDGLEELTESLCRVTSLQVLELKNCKRLMKLPNCIGYLPCLERLVLDNAQSLEKLPDSFGNLSSLRYLHLDGCILQNLPNKLEGLSSLLHLHLRSCTKIRKLPETLLCPTLTSLEFINCISLEALPTKLTHFVSLRRLVLSFLKNLQGLPKDLSRLCSLEYLEIMDCKIRQLPQSFGSLQSLRELKIESCDITELPEGFGELSALETLEIKKCSKLRRLCSDFTGLPSLRRLYVYGCGSLEGEWMDRIVKLSSIQRVLIEGSDKLINRWLSTDYENCKASVHYVDNHRLSLSLTRRVTHI